MLIKNRKWDKVLGLFLEKWVCGHLEGCLLREYGVPSRIGILDWVEVWHRVLASPGKGHHLSVAGYKTRSYASMVIDRIGFDLDSDPKHLDKALRDAQALIRHLREQYGADGALQFTGRRGYRVWVFLKQPLSPSIYPEFVRSLLGSLRLETLDLPASLDKRHLFRIPYTVHEATGKRTRFLDPKSLEPVRAEDWDYQLYEPLDPRSVKIFRVVVEPPKIILASGRPRAGRGKAGYYDYIENALKNGLPDGRKRFILWVASRYLVNVKGLGLEEALGELEGFLGASCRNHGNCSRIYSSWLRSVLRGVAAGGYKPPSLRRLREKHPDLYKVITGATGGGNELEGLGKPLPEPLRSFLEETGLTVFSYEDVKRWLESKKGRVTSGEWSRVTRQLRKLAEEGLLGRMYLVDGEWLDYGPGPVEKPPSRKVTFYII